MKLRVLKRVLSRRLHWHPVISLTISSDHRAMLNEMIH